MGISQLCTSVAVNSGNVTTLKGPTALKASGLQPALSAAKSNIIGGGSRSHYIPGVPLRLGPSTMNVLHVTMFMNE